MKLKWPMFLCVLLSGVAQMQAQSPEIKLVADTLVVQAEGSYESDPDVATVTFDVSAQEKELKDAYGKATQSMRTIVSVAERNGLSKDSIETGVLTVTPFYEGDRKQRARSYSVQGHVALKIKDFAKVGPIMDESVQDGIVDFRSLSYSLANEEAAKQKAIADAMRRAVDRASVALEQTRQKLGPARSVSLEVTNLVGIANFESLSHYNGGVITEEATSGGIFSKHKAVPPPPPPPVQPGKITISASVQCIFQIEK